MVGRRKPATSCIRPVLPHGQAKFQLYEGLLASGRLAVRCCTVRVAHTGHAPAHGLETMAGGEKNARKENHHSAKCSACVFSSPSHLGMGEKGKIFAAGKCAHMGVNNETWGSKILRCAIFFACGRVKLRACAPCRVKIPGRAGVQPSRHIPAFFLRGGP